MGAKEYVDGLHMLSKGVYALEPFGIPYVQEHGGLIDAITVDLGMCGIPFSERQLETVSEYVGGYTVQEIARKHGISVPAIYQALNGAIAKIDKGVIEGMYDFDYERYHENF